MRYTVDVVEVMHQKKLYTVEADSPEEAVGKARRGDTEAEDPLGDYEVFDRAVFETTVREEGSATVLTMDSSGREVVP